MTPEEFNDVGAFLRMQIGSLVGIVLAGSPLQDVHTLRLVSIRKDGLHLRTIDNETDLFIPTSSLFAIAWDSSKDEGEDTK